MRRQAPLTGFEQGKYGQRDGKSGVCTKSAQTVGRGVKKGVGGREETNVPAPAAVVVIVVATSLPWHQHSTIAVKAGAGHWLCNAKVSTLFNQSILDLNAHKFGIIKTTVDN